MTYFDIPCHDTWNILNLTRLLSNRIIHHNQAVLKFNLKRYKTPPWEGDYGRLMIAIVNKVVIYVVSESRRLSSIVMIVQVLNYLLRLVMRDWSDVIKTNSEGNIPANTRRWFNAGLMLTHTPQCWPTLASNPNQSALESCSFEVSSHDL